MRSVSRGVFGLVVGATTIAVACGIWPTFPDDQLHPDTLGLDGGTTDAGLFTDGPVIPDGPSMDSSLDAVVPDGSVSDGGLSPDAGPDAGLGCSMVPSAAVASSILGTAIPGATDFAFDGHGSIAVGFGSEIDTIAPGGVRSMLVAMLPGNVVTVRYAPTGDVLMALVTPTDAGPPMGVIAAFTPGSPGSYRVLVSNVGSPGGLAVDTNGYVWFSDGVSGTVSRFLLGSTVSRPVEVFSDVPGPTALAFDGTGSVLYVASASTTGTASIYQVNLTYGDGGTSVTTLPATQFAGGLNAIKGLAVDECSNVYAVDQSRNRIWRIPPPPLTTFVEIVTDITNPTGLAFGQGGAYDGRTLFSLDTMGTLHAAGVVAPGVPLPTPP